MTSVSLKRYILHVVDFSREYKVTISLSGHRDRMHVASLAMLFELKVNPSEVILGVHR